MAWLAVVVLLHLAPPVPEEPPGDAPDLTASPEQPAPEPPALTGDDPLPQPRAPDAANPHWVFVQGNAAALGMLGGQARTTFGFSAYLGGAFGRPFAHGPDDEQLRGLFVGAGVLGFTGSTDLPQCPGIHRCAGRQALGGAVRVGLAFWNRNDRAVPAFIWPDTYLYAQLGGFAGRETIPSQPLAPGVATGLYGLRFDLGVTSIGFSRAFLWLLSGITGNISLSDGSLPSLLLVPLVLLNHFELNFEWSSQAFSPGGARVGLSVGAGF